MHHSMQQIVHKKVFCINPVSVGFLSTFKTEFPGKWRVTIKTGIVLHCNLGFKDQTVKGLDNCNVKLKASNYWKVTGNITGMLIVNENGYKTLLCTEQSIIAFK